MLLGQLQWSWVVNVRGVQVKCTGVIYNDSEYFMAVTSVGVVKVFWLFCLILFSLEHHFPAFLSILWATNFLPVTYYFCLSYSVLLFVIYKQEPWLMQILAPGTYAGISWKVWEIGGNLNPLELKQWRFRSNSGMRSESSQHTVGNTVIKLSYHPW